MNDEADQAEEQLPLESVGEQLKRAREDAGKSLKEIADETRIPMRHLEVIEAGDFGALPARTYAIGFSRTYAKAVGLDERGVATKVREELAGAADDSVHRPARFEPGDPARVPSRGLAWFSAFAVLLLVVGGLTYFRGYFFPGSGPGALVDETQVAAVEDTSETPGFNGDATAPAPTGQVVFTALKDDVWVRFYDGSGERLLEKVMAAGERYAVPVEADDPQINTGQPEALSITVGGEPIGNLSNESEVISDISVTAEALIARSQELEAEASVEEAEPGGADAA